MAERTLQKRHGHVKTVIVRPSIIISTMYEPFPGWTDTISAGGGVTFAISAGFMHYVRSKGYQVLDFIPADIVVNTIIAASVFTAISPDLAMRVVHSSSTGKNPMVINDYCTWILRHDNYMHFFTQEYPGYVEPIHREWEY